VEESILVWVAKWKDAIALISSLLNLILVTALTAITWAYVKATQQMVTASQDSVATMKAQLDEAREERRRPLRNMLNYLHDGVKYWAQRDLNPLSPAEVAESWKDFATTQEHLELIESTKARSFALHRLLENQLIPTARRFSDSLMDVVRGKEATDNERVQRGLNGRTTLAQEFVGIIGAAEQELQKF
jgi:type II secretory pathway pseudopilin PulG